MRLEAITRRRLRVIIPALATIVVVAPLAYLWQASLLPKSLSVMDMGYADYGGGPMAVHDHGGSITVPDLRMDPHRKPDVTVDLATEQSTLRIAGQALSGFTVNGTSPGPIITALRGQLVEVHLRNVSVVAGVALHWHGVDVPNSMDGVAGVTQDSVPVGGAFTYRFIAEDAGTYWYHSHQVSDRQVAGGLFGALVIKPRTGVAESIDITAIAHTYAGIKTLNGEARDLRVAAKPGQQVRVRMINTDNGPIQTWAGGPYRVLAVDGHDVHEPTEIADEAVAVTAGGRVDLGVTMPADGSPVRVQLSKATAVILGSGDPPPVAQPTAPFDALSYGTAEALPFDPAQAVRHFDYSIGHRPGFVRGKPGLWWSINGHLYPKVPMYVVREGDIVTMRIDNHSGDVHPMHLHGHHAVVLARNGVPASGSPWWFDTLNVADGENYDIGFVADNPGVWMDHCHNLQHAAQGMVAHLMYEGVTTPYVIGGPPANQPE